MRPIKEIFVEEYWNIAYRCCDKNDTVIDGKKDKYSFDELKATKRYWYADPFLFEKDGKTYLFVEMFDNVTEKGLIGCSEFLNGKFSQPKIVLEESFHLSYPYVFEENGVVYMMPETREDGCVQLYRAESFPTKWVKDRVILEIKDAVDTVIDGENIITSVITDPAAMKTQLEIYNLRTGRPYGRNPIKAPDQISRGAGRIITHNGVKIIPAQNCTGANYGAGLIFYKIENDYGEKKVSELSPAQIEAGTEKILGTHTYACTDKIEIVDVKKNRFNFRRMIWIIKKKI